MFSDPQSVTVNSVAQSLPRIQIDGSKAIYQKNDGLFTLTVSHEPRKDDRISHKVRLEQKAIVTDPLTAANDYDTLSLSVEINRPAFGFSLVQIEQLTTAFVAWLSTANVDKLYGKEI
jgi:hypothetical protein